MRFKPGVVLSLCDRTGNMVKPWAEAGCNCVCVDTQHEPGLTKHPTLPIWYAGKDVRDFEWPSPTRIVFAFPPCTDMAVSGARWFRDKGLSAIITALQIVEACRRICDGSGAPYMIENPVSTLATYWREPDHTFDPCDYGGYLNPPGDTYTKRTCIWAGNGFVMPKPQRVEPVQGSLMHLMPPSADRADKRSETPRGFARAVFEANSRFQLEATA